jgi:steroid 5-alpha reductase family enzyme
MTLVSLLLQNAGISALCLVLLWLVSLKLRDVSFVDSWWALGIVVLAVATHFETAGSGIAGTVLLVLCAIWGLRLGLYLFWRWRSHGADPRYQAIFRSAEARRGWSFALTSGLQVFALQGVLQFLVALPVQLGQLDDASRALGPLGWIGAGVAVFGILFESIGDWQLLRFRRNPAHENSVLDSGLWRYTRHPNYFGDTCVWWGLYLIAAETPLGIWSLLSPILVTVLLTRVSGVPMLEHRLRRNRPDYLAYIARTSGFIPWPPNRG